MACCKAKAVLIKLARPAEPSVCLHLQTYALACAYSGPFERMHASRKEGHIPNDCLDRTHKKFIRHFLVVPKEGRGDGLGFLWVSSLSTSAVGVEELRTVLYITNIKSGSRICITDELCLSYIARHG